MPTSRRKFLKLCAAAGAVTVTAAVAANFAINRSAAGKESSDAEEEEEIPQRWGMMIDLDKCDGCADRRSRGQITACLEGCATDHRIPKKFLPDGTKADEPQPWIELFEKEDNPLTGPYFLPRPCMQCAAAPCVHVCPTRASFKDRGGLTHIDHRICIGCRMCMAACPYNARSFNWGEPEPWFGTHEEEIELSKQHGGYSPMYPLPHVRGTPTKCDFCQHTVLQDEAKLPACVINCPNGAIYYGDLNQNAVTNGKSETLPLSKTLKSRSGYRYQEELGTNPKVFYLPKSG
ncbi:MAG: 4Fe-4S dicluster domain-containing protein [Candidatus Odinarchaeota archaeon]